MKKMMTLILGIFLITMSALAGQCNGDMEFGGIFADLICKGGQCSGYIPAQKIKFNGTCTDEIDFEANASFVATYVRGACVDGTLSISANSQFINLYGDCKKYDEVVGVFSSLIHSPNYSGSGYCQPNGMTRLYFGGATRPFIGDCHLSTK